MENSSHLPNVDMGNADTRDQKNLILKVSSSSNAKNNPVPERRALLGPMEKLIPFTCCIWLK